MDNHINARIAAIAAALERRKMEQEWPEDGLSRSLGELGRELAELDAAGRDVLFEEWNTPDADGTRISMTREQFDRFISDYSMP